jgi:hypothetical protein
MISAKNQYPLTITMQDFTSSYCTCQTATNDRAKHIIETHVHDILVNTLQPVFKRQTQIHPVLSNRPEPRYRAAHEYDLHENQEWKTGNIPNILLWIVDEISASFYQFHFN